MRANELRIGNYVQDRIHREVTVSEIRPEHLVFYLSNGNKIKHHIKTFEPIPLTEDWLLSFGWGREFHWEFLYIDNTSLNSIVFFYDVKAMILIIETDKDAVELNHIKHVHQLQNLYFALTGKELKRRMKDESK